MDGQSYQFPGEKREPVPVKPGKTAKEDYEYIREGTCGIFGSDPQSMRSLKQNRN
jgi:hypothetical protein